MWRLAARRRLVGLEDSIVARNQFFKSVKEEGKPAFYGLNIYKSFSCSFLNFIFFPNFYVNRMLIPVSKFDLINAPLAG